MQSQRQSVQTIELTAKRLKLQRVLAIVVTVAAGLALFNGLRADPDNRELVYAGFAGMIFGLAWQCVVQVRTWWNHA